MKYKNTLIVVSDMDASVRFYQRILGLRVIADFGANKTLTGGICLQTEETYRSFIHAEAITYGSKNMELYFEEEHFEVFLGKLKDTEVEYVHPLIEHDWGQRVVRFYDPDHHIIEVGEPLDVVVKRFLDSGMNIEQTAEKMGVPVSFVNRCIRR